AKYPGKVRFVDAFDPALAQRIYGGSDIFLMPSSFEPCGLGQMFAMRYGTVPVVRKTGGLADTVTDGVNGFVFEHRSSEELAATLKRAFRA
ncbi:glycosyltransferase, partial [Acinetobacter baumannii]